jgi:hypothetical protein
MLVQVDARGIDDYPKVLMISMRMRGFGEKNSTNAESPARLRFRCSCSCSCVTAAGNAPDITVAAALLLEFKKPIVIAHETTSLPIFG